MNSVSSYVDESISLVIGIVYAFASKGVYLFKVSLGAVASQSQLQQMTLINIVSLFFRENKTRCFKPYFLRKIKVKKNRNKNKMSSAAIFVWRFKGEG